MSDSEHPMNKNPGYANSLPENPQSGHAESVLNAMPDLEKLIPQNLSSNKRAVIARLIALHRAELNIN